jgi:L-ribulokinase
MDKFVIGLDFGTDSVRASLVHALTGEEIKGAVALYPRWKEKLYCDPGQSIYRQHPLDYVESLVECIRQVLSGVRKEITSKVVAISVATTGSTPVAIDASGTPLSMLPEFSENPNAMFILWKDHSAHAEAEEINHLAHGWPIDYTKYSGGVYSPEWFWAKILHISRADEGVRSNAFSWVEHCDWIPALLTGITDANAIKRSRCAAGHKAMWHEAFAGLPSAEFLNALDPAFASIRPRLYAHTFTSDEPAGNISSAWASRLGLPPTVKVGVGGIDAHFGAVGAGIKPHSLVKVIGTSSCDMLITPNEAFGNHIVKGICGQVNGSIIPNMLGMEAGQSAFGDLFAWFREILAFSFSTLDGIVPSGIPEKATDQLLPSLSAAAASLPVHNNDMVALDWINGRRTPHADLNLTAAISGIRLDSGAPHIFKALAEATAFGSKAIVDHFKSEGITIGEVIALGGIAKKSSFVMQTLANILHMPIKVVRSEQACGLGSAMFAATVAGVYPSVEVAQHSMSSGFASTYLPENEKADIYDKLYSRYCDLSKIS